MLARFNEDMAGVLLSVHVPDIRPYGEIVSDSDGKIQAFREKQPIHRAGYINGGVYLFNETIADAFPKGQETFSMERDVFPSVSNLYTHWKQMRVGSISGCQSDWTMRVNISHVSEIRILPFHLFVTPRNSDTFLHVSRLPQQRPE